MEAIRDGDGHGRVLLELTAREKEVLGLLVEGADESACTP